MIKKAQKKVCEFLEFLVRILVSILLILRKFQFHRTLILVWPENMELILSCKLSFFNSHQRSSSLTKTLIFVQFVLKNAPNQDIQSFLSLIEAYCHSLPRLPFILIQQNVASIHGLY